MKLRYKVYLAFIFILAGAGYTIYQCGLTDEAKQSIKEAIQSVSKSYTSIKEVIESYTGIIMDDNQPLPNVQETAREWKAIGY